MNYGNKIKYLLLILICFFLIGCNSKKDFYYELYDGYQIKSVDNDIKLYKDNEVIKIDDLDYQIKKFKYNSDVVCILTNDNKYYMIYYVDGQVLGPHTEESLNESITSLSMTFEEDFQDILKAEGRVYE